MADYPVFQEPGEEPAPPAVEPVTPDEAEQEPLFPVERPDTTPLHP